MSKKIKRGKMYYLVLENGSYTGRPNAIVPVRVIRKERYDSHHFIVEQEIGSDTHRITVSDEWLAPFNTKAAKAANAGTGFSKT